MALPMFERSSPQIRCIAVASGKGGVGKSTVAVNLALALKEQGFSVGVLDADVYGPSLRNMLPEDRLPVQSNDVIQPALAKGIRTLSMAYFRQIGEAIAVRAPIANGIITQFLHQVNWGPLDYLLIDFPPGTGDIQLTLSQKAGVMGAVLVTTPQELALLDVRRASDLFKQVGVPILGIVENMSGMKVPASQEIIHPFGQGGGARFAKERGYKFLGKVLLDPQIRICSDQGISLFHTGSEEKSTFLSMAAQLTDLIDRGEWKETKSFHLEWQDMGGDA